MILFSLQRLTRQPVIVLGLILGGLVVPAKPCRAQEPAANAEAEASLLDQAWQAFSAGRFGPAEQLYRQAAAADPASVDAELGLGWSLQRLGRCAEARPHFQLVLKQRGDVGAQQGLALCPAPRRLRLYLGLSQGVFMYSQHPRRELASATTARLGALLYERWLLSAAYRFSYFSTREQNSAPWLQHDVYASAGYAARKFGVSLHYGLLQGSLSEPISVSGTAASDYANTSHHFGATARYSPFGDGFLSAAVSLYPTDTVVRGELSWWLPVVRGLRVRPAAALQWSGSMLRPSAALTVAYDHTRFGLFAGGKYGPELRPAQLAYEVVYNGPERIPYGLWAGAIGHPGGGFTLSVSYGYDRLLSDTTDATTGAVTTTPSDAHYLTLSLSKEL